MTSSAQDKAVAVEALHKHINALAEQQRTLLRDKKSQLAEIENCTNTIMCVKRVIADLEDEHNELFLK